MQQQNDVPVITDYEVRRKRLVFACPGCGTPLKADLSDAGRHEQCPQCTFAFRVPDHQPATVAAPEKKGEPWYQRDILGRSERLRDRLAREMTSRVEASTSHARERVMQRESTGRSDQQYEFLRAGANVLFFLGVLNLIAAVIAGMAVGNEVGGGWGWLTWLAGTGNAFLLMIIAQVLDAFRDLVLHARSIDETLSSK